MSAGDRSVVNHFSPSLMLAGMDYIAPSAECILPVTLRPQGAAGTGGGGGGGTGSVGYRLGDDTETGGIPLGTRRGGDVLKITLKDCLACSGCVTTAETILVNSQSREELLKARETQCASPDGPPPLLVTISDPTAASIAAYAGLPTVEDGFALIAGFVRAMLGSTPSSLASTAEHRTTPLYVTDLRWANAISTAKTAQEYARRLREDPSTLPLLVSACPGWVCYCEKQGGALLPHLSPVLSAQGIAGSYAKRCLSQNLYHISLQPCFDRKLEAARDHMMPQAPQPSSESPGPAVYYTDCVLSTGELLEWMLEVDPSLPWRGVLDTKPLALSHPHVTRTGAALTEPTLATNEEAVAGSGDTSTHPVQTVTAPQLFAAGVEGSGGFHRVVMEYMHAKAVPCDSATEGATPPLCLHYEQKRNHNHQLITTPSLPGQVFCVAYGFQQIQNTVRAIKKKLPAARAYTLVELMACPDGCLNGGGQVRSADPTNAEATLHRVKTVFAQSLSDTDRSAGEADPAMAVLSPPIRQSRLEEGQRRQLDAPPTEPCYVQTDLFSPDRIRAAADTLGESLWRCTFTDRQKEFEKLLDEGHVQSLKW